MSERNTALKIPTEYLPQGWKAEGAERFNLAERTIKAIVLGERENTEVFDHFLAIAEAEKARREEEQKTRINRLKALKK